MEIRAVQLQAPASSQTQDYTVTDFGTPDAAIVVYHIGGTADTDVDDYCLGYGFWDGTNMRCAYGTADHGIDMAGGTIQGGSYNNVFVRFHYAAATGTVTSATVSNITNGVQLDWTINTNRPYCTVYLIKGLTGVQVGSFLPNTGTDATTGVTTTGITPNVIFAAQLANSAAGENAIRAECRGPSFGFAVDDGSASQACFTPTIRDLGYTSGGVHARNNRMVQEANNAGSYELTAFTNGGSDGFTVTHRVGTNSTNGGYILYLAAEDPDSADVFTHTLPTSAGDWSPYTGNFKPQSVIMFQTALTAFDSFSSASAAASVTFGHYFVSQSSDTIQEDYGVAMCLDSGATVTTSDNSTRIGDDLMLLPNTGGTPTFIENDPTFTASGITFGSAASAGSAYIGIGIALSGPSAVNTTIIVPTGPWR